MQTRNTQQRQLIRDLLANNDSHPTADEIYELARKRNPSISRGTVYRNLNLLAECGEIKRLQMPSGPDHFDPSTAPHHHFLCRKCGRILDAGDPGQALAPPEFPALTGCKIETCELLLKGLCPDCR